MERLIIPHVFAYHILLTAEECCLDIQNIVLKFNETTKVIESTDQWVFQHCIYNVERLIPHVFVHHILLPVEEWCLDIQNIVLKFKETTKVIESIDQWDF